MNKKMKKGNSVATSAFAATEPKFNNSRDSKVSPIHESPAILLIEGQNEDDNQAMAFIEEYAFGDQSNAVRSLMQKAKYSESNEYEVNEADIYRDLASKEHEDFLHFILSDQLLDLESIA